MPEETKVSEATVETSQVVEEKPSESAEEQVATAEPSEEAKPAQEPEEKPSVEDALAKLTADEVEALPDDHPVKRFAKGIADKSTLKLREELQGEARQRERQAQQERTLQEAKERRDRNQATFRQLQALEQTKPDEWRQHLRNPEYAAIWNEGLNTTPSTVELDAAKDGGRSEGGRAMLDQLAQRLNSRPEMENLTQEELAILDSAKFSQNLDGYIDQIVAAAGILGKRIAGKGFEKDKTDFEEEVRKNEREKIQAKYREAGVPLEELEGKGASSGLLTLKQYEAKTAEERAKLSDAEIDAMYARERGV